MEITVIECFLPIVFSIEFNLIIKATNGLAMTSRNKNRLNFISLPKCFSMFGCNICEQAKKMHWMCLSLWLWHFCYFGNRISIHLLFTFLFHSLFSCLKHFLFFFSSCMCIIQIIIIEKRRREIRRNFHSIR